MFNNLPEGATPLDGDEAGQLIATHISTQAELNAWEQQNIIEAIRWSEATRRSALNVDLIRDLHRRMFDRTWKWAGTFRQSDKNIGCPWPMISVQLRDLIADGELWLEDRTYGIDEAALRLHHRLVKIHPFPNGNGRHARLWCDVFLRQHRRPPLAWRDRDLIPDGGARRAYIDALRHADRFDYRPLLDLFLRGRGTGST